MQLPGFLFTISLIDTIGRRRMFMLGLGVGTVLLWSLALMANPAALTVLVCLVVMQIGVGMLALSLSTYTAELYPTELRALGSGFGNAWLRLGGTAGPAFIGAHAAVVRPQGHFRRLRVPDLRGRPRHLFLRGRDEGPGAGAPVAVAWRRNGRRARRRRSWPIPIEGERLAQILAPRARRRRRRLALAPSGARGRYPTTSTSSPR